MSDPAMKHAALLTQDLVMARWRVAFDLEVGTGRRHSFETLAAETGIPARTLRSYRDREASPPLTNALKIMAALGVPFAEALVELGGFAGLRAIEAAAPAARQVQHDVAKFLAKLSEDLMRTGELDHRHRRPLAARLRPVLAELEAFVVGLECEE